MVKKIAEQADLFLRRAQALPSRETIQPIVSSIVGDLNIPGSLGVTAPVDIEKSGDTVYVYFQIDVKPEVYDDTMEKKPLTYNSIKERVESALFQHFPLNQFHVSFGYFTKPTEYRT